MFHISTKSKFCKTFKNGMPKSKENTSTPKLKKKDVKLMRPKPSPSRKQRRLPRLMS